MKNLLKIISTIEPDETNLLVLDDQMLEAGNLEETSKLFTLGSHHRNITVFYINQNVFDKGKVNTTIALNSDHMVLFKNPRDKGQMRSLSQQVLKTDVKYFMDAFREALRKSMIPYC